MKKDGTIPVYGDYRFTVNQAAKLDTYPLLLIDDLFASLAGGVTFSKLDLAHAYQQVVLDDDAKNNDQHPQRLSSDVAAAPSIFHFARAPKCLCLSR